MRTAESHLRRLQEAAPFDVDLLFERDFYGGSWSWIAYYPDRVLISHHHAKLLAWARVFEGEVVAVDAVPPEEWHATELKYEWRLRKHHKAELLASIVIGEPYDPDFGGLFANSRSIWQRFGPEQLPSGEQRHATLISSWAPNRSVMVTVDVDGDGRVTQGMLYQQEPAYKLWRELVEASRGTSA